MTYPTVHLNGTSKNELERQYAEALDAIRAAIVAVNESAPNGRDYYPQGQDALLAAGCEHRERIFHLETVQRELNDLWEHLDADTR